jgi:hypothetical protein
MTSRLLNVASIVCLVVCVALMGMWVRSYWRIDAIGATSGHNDFVIGSERGVIFCGGNGRFRTAITTGAWRIENDLPDDGPLPQPSFLLFHFEYEQSGAEFLIPYWFLVLSTGLLSILVWYKRAWRFTLRDLLIVTTLLTIVLGMIVWLDRAQIGK